MIAALLEPVVRLLWCRWRHRWRGNSRRVCWACSTMYDPFPSLRDCCCGRPGCDGRGTWPEETTVFTRQRRDGRELRPGDFDTQETT